MSTVHLDISTGYRIDAGYHHATFPGGFGWWIGVLRRGRTPIWQCGHQHENRSVALTCVEHLIRALRDMTDPVVWREPAPREEVG